MQKELPPYFDGYGNNLIESLYLIGRLKSTVNMTEAAADANLLYQQILHGFPDAPLNQENLEKLRNTRIELTPMATGLSELRTHFSKPLKILLVVVALAFLLCWPAGASAHRTPRHRESCSDQRNDGSHNVPPGSPVGRHYSRGSDKDTEVIGVVGDAKVNSLQEARGRLYAARFQRDCNED